MKAIYRANHSVKHQGQYYRKGQEIPFGAKETAEIGRLRDLGAITRIIIEEEEKIEVPKGEAKGRKDNSKGEAKGEKAPADSNPLGGTNPPAGSQPQE